MPVSVQEGPSIHIGYVYRLSLKSASTAFPEASVIKGHFRNTVGSDTLICELSTGAGITRKSDVEIQIEIPPEVTSTLQVGEIIGDFVRTDVTPNEHLQFSVKIPVLLPVTRGLTP